MTYIIKSPQILSRVRFLDIYMAGHKGYIAGGCFKNIFTGKKIKDVDIFFESETDFAEASLYFKDNEQYVFSYENANTIAYKNKATNIRVELIRRFFDAPGPMLNRFDFSITKFAYIKMRNAEGDSITYECMLHPDFFEHLTCKKLVLEKNILFPASTFERSLRYTKYGYGLCRESKENLLNALQGADLSNLTTDLYFGID